MNDQELGEYLTRVQIFLNQEALTDEQRSKVKIVVSVKEREYREHCGA